jgi:glycosyltransferase involved in cell wall biosynthesis
LRALAHSSGVADQVRFVGFITDPERFLQDLDIAAFPSRSDSFCLAAVEAMSCGLPVVASAVDGLAEIIQDGHSGLLIPPDDPAALATTLERLCRDAALRQTLGRAARCEVETRFAVERIAVRFEALCR